MSEIQEPPTTTGAPAPQGPPVPAAEGSPAAEAELARAHSALAHVDDQGIDLHLHRMEVSGFKSFSDRTEIRFREGITAVVGPNGCGKSNIGDAINWVLGAQSPKLLRGSKMQDVIFNGTQARRPMGMAEVSLHLIAAEAAEPSARREIVITRRLFRDGDSEYLLNGARARLKDIQEILRRAHVGAKTYATIEQGQIDHLLNAKPRDRRMIIEDAAGVSGFKHKRRLAELKLEATHANLLRVNDIVTEVRRQINSLKRQAAKARRYQRLREQLRAKKLVRFVRRADEMERELARLREVEGQARDTESGVAARMAKLEAEVAAERQALEDADREFRETAREFHQLEAEVDRKRERIDLCRERIEEAGETSRRLGDEIDALEERLDSVRAEMETVESRAGAERAEVDEVSARLADKQSELDEASARAERLQERVEEIRRGLFDSMNHAAEQRNRRRSVEEALERNALQRSRLAEERDSASADLERVREETDALDRESETARSDVDRVAGELADLERRLAEAREDHASRLESLSTAREREKSAAARLRTLEDVATRFAGVSDGVRMLLSAPSSSGVRAVGVVADYVEAGQRLEGAAEVYLQSILPAVVLEDDTDAARAASLLRSQGAGRTSFISRTQPTGAPAVGAAVNGRPAFPEEVLNDPRVIGRLKDHVKLKTAANGFVRDRIGDAIVVDTLENAFALHRTHPYADYLTPGGEVVYASGVVAAGGAGAGDHGLLAHQRKTREAREELAEASADVATASGRVDAGKQEQSTLEESVRARQQELDGLRQRILELGVREQRHRDEQDRTRRRSEIAAEEIAGLEDETRRLESDAADARRDVEAAEQRHREAEGRLEAAAAEAERARQGIRDLTEDAAGLREQLAARRQRLENVESQKQQLGDVLSDVAGRIELSRRESEACERRAREASELRTRTEEKLAKDLSRREAVQVDVSRREQGLAERRAAVDAREEDVRGLRSELETRRQESSSAELARARAESERSHLDDLCAQEIGMSVAEAVAARPPAEEDDDIDLDALETEIAEIHAKIETIGPVNMTAIEEFSDLEERDAFLTFQRKDLEDSMESLKETIRRINRSSRERFAEAFEAIRKNYQEIFQTLFNGGRADLRLEEGEDVLDCGIEIMAQPPGKRLGSVMLMSGGEKAMSAIALLFAIFRFQPSPFCLLDEVDAALDDVNVGRFTRMLEQYAEHNQFIIITHNKLSMEVANLLYGVTMEEPGVSKVVSLQMR